MNHDDFERAVALHNDQEGAPTVLASGEGHIARLIKERADAAGIPMVEDPKLSYLLSKIPLGDEIPPGQQVRLGEQSRLCHRLR